MSQNTDHKTSAIPAGAVHLGAWCIDRGRVRAFRGTARPIDGPDSAHVTIVGQQHADGRVERRVQVGEMTLTAAQGRQLARALISATDEIDALSDADWSIVR